MQTAADDSPEYYLRWYRCSSRYPRHHPGGDATCVVFLGEHLKNWSLTVLKYYNDANVQKYRALNAT